MVDQEMTLLNNVIVTFVAILVLYEIVLYLTGNRSFLTTIWENLKLFGSNNLNTSVNKVFNNLMPVLSANVNRLSNYMNKMNGSNKIVGSNNQNGTVNSNNSYLKKSCNKYNDVFHQYPRDQLNDSAKTHLDRNQYQYTNYDHNVEYNLDPIYHSGWENFVRPQPKVHTEYDPSDMKHQQEKMEPWNYMSNSSNETLVRKTGQLLPKPIRLDSCNNFPKASNETLGPQTNADRYENQLVQNYPMTSGNINEHVSQQLNHLHDETHYQRHFDRVPSQVTSADRYNSAAAPPQRGEAVGQENNIYFNGMNVSQGMMLPQPILNQLTGTNMQYSGDVRENSWVDVPWRGGQPDIDLHYKTRNLSENPSNVHYMDSSDYPLHLSHKPADYNNRASSINDFSDFTDQYVSESMGAENMPRDSFSDFY